GTTFNTCEECGTHHLGALEEAESCAEDNCCFKYICPDDTCWFRCSLCGRESGDELEFRSVADLLPRKPTDRDRQQQIACYPCVVKNKFSEVHGVRIWYGISIREHIRRYGY